MERKKEDMKPRISVSSAGPVVDHNAETPLWHKYYQRVRKTIRFPRYYKRELNW